MNSSYSTWETPEKLFNGLLESGEEFYVDRSLNPEVYAALDKYPEDTFFALEQPFDGAFITPLYDQLNSEMSKNDIVRGLEDIAEDWNSRIPEEGFCYLSDHAWEHALQSPVRNKTLREEQGLEPISLNWIHTQEVLEFGKYFSEVEVIKIGKGEDSFFGVLARR